jgi:DNA repair protein RadA/Sms
MAKTRTQYVCQSCGAASPKWLGRCPECEEYNTFVEMVVERRVEGASVASTPLSRPEALVAVQSGDFSRIPVPLPEFSRVLGGGIVPGSVVLIGGDPGIGKSTLLLQVSNLLAGDQSVVLYVSGEESAQQIKMRAERLGTLQGNLYVLAEIDLGQIMAHIERLKPRLVVVDSIQSIYSDELTAAAGSVSQVKECASKLLRLAKSSHIPIFIVGHVTKTGAIAGPRVMEHIVDTVLYLEGERFHAYRLLRGVKNRFGSTNEVGVFEMRNEGLVEVANPSEAFLAERLTHAAGSAVAITLEGTRPLLVEIQALASTTSFGLPRRTANGIDFNRLLLLVAVLTKRVGLRLSDQDVFVNVIGGLRVNEPAADLSVALAIASSLRNVPVAADLAVVGEIGLSGELRSVSQLPKRLNEAAQLGFKRCIVPSSPHAERHHTPKGLEIISTRILAEALDIALR